MDPLWLAFDPKRLIAAAYAGRNAFAAKPPSQRFSAQRMVDHFYGLYDPTIVSGAKSEANQRKRIWADDLIGGSPSIIGRMIGKANELQGLRDSG